MKLLRNPCHAGLVLTLAISAPVLAQTFAPRDLSQASLEDLLNVQVTSVSKKEQKLSKTGAAVYVITQEDIRRSGANSIPDLLRMVPGVHVAQIDAHVWAISIRGFTDRYGDKVLVLIDGRSVYSPLTSGVNWDQQDVPLEDIDRIEVIRGPGGTVWGANAVNGVINIITLSAKVTHGGLVTAGGGSQKAADGLVQYGGTFSDSAAYRVFGSYANIGNSPSSVGYQTSDAWHKSHLGFRSDWTLSPRDNFTVQGDFIQAVEGETIDTLFSNNLFIEKTFGDKTTFSAGNVLGRWNHNLLNGSNLSLQVYYDGYTRLDRGLIEARNTVDVDFQHHVRFGRNDVVWGLGYRVTSDHTTPGYATTYLPLRRTDQLFSTFIQDEITLASSLLLTVGSKFEHNSYTGFEYEPSVRLVWAASEHQAVWISGSRAIRQPSRSDLDLYVTIATVPLEGGGLGVVQITGDPVQRAEQLYDFEVGYRAVVSNRFSFDVATFLSYYHGLQTNEPGVPFFQALPNPPHLIIPLFFDDGAHAHNYGSEIATNWEVTRRWRISPGYSFLQMHVAGNSWSQDPGAGSIANESPKHQFQIHSLLNLPHSLEWDCALYRVGRLTDGGAGSTPGYFRMDTRLGWRIGESIDLSLVGQNLFSPARAEYHDALGVIHTLVARSISGKITWRF